MDSMTTLKTVDRIVDENQKCMFFVDTNCLRKILTQDCLAISNALVEAVKEKRPEMYLGRMGYMEGYDNACEDIIAIIRTVLESKN